jgi:hypothetical protein
MFTIEETEIAAAIERAKVLHPRVRMIEFGTYEVTGSKAGSTYTVKCYRDGRGHKTIDCTCKTRDGVACKHGMAAVALHIAMAAQRRAGR